MDNTHVCSRCKKVAMRARGTSIHKTLAYTRCRCHRFSKESMAQVSSVLVNAPEPKPDSSTNLRSVLGTASHFISPSIHSDSQRQSVYTTSRSDRQITLPRIVERPSLAADFPPVVVATDINGYSDLETQVIHGSQVNAPSATALEVSSLPKLLPRSSPNRKTGGHEIAHHQKLKAPRADVYKLVDLVEFIPHSKKCEIHQLFKDSDADGDGHLSLVEFMGCLPGLDAHKNDVEFIKQLYTRLNIETFFGTKEFMLGYYVAEILSKPSSIDRLTQKHHLKENFIDILAFFMSILAKKSSKDGLVSITTIEEAAQAVKLAFHYDNIKVISSVLVEIALDGQLHLLQCLSFSPYYLCI